MVGVVLSLASAPSLLHNVSEVFHVRHQPMSLPTNFRSRRLVAPLTVLALLAACAAPDAVAPSPGLSVGARPEIARGLAAFELPMGDRDPTLLYCPTPSTRRVVQDVDPALGGVVGVAGTFIAIPPGAIPGAAGALVPVSVEVPASSYAEVSIRVGEVEHFQFASSVAITIGYGRCVAALDPTGGEGSPATGLQATLDAWHIEPGSYALLENMGALDDRRKMALTFLTDHVSGYALATSRSRLSD